MKPLSRPILGVGVLTAALITAGITGTQSATPAAKAATPIVVQAAPASHEGDPSWNCATMGNHLCGPKNGEKLKAGCYDNAVLVIPWAKLSKAQKHSLTSPCTGMAPTQEQESDAAYAAANHRPAGGG